MVRYIPEPQKESIIVQRFLGRAYLRVPEGVIGLWEKTGSGKGEDRVAWSHARGVFDLDSISLEAKVEAV